MVITSLSRKRQRKGAKEYISLFLALLTLCLVYASAHMIQKSPVPVYTPEEAVTTFDLGTLPKHNRKQQLFPKALNLGTEK